MSAAQALAATLLPPPKTCTCCGKAVPLAAWLANASRRYWPGELLEIAEHECKSTLAVEINPEPAVVR